MSFTQPDCFWLLLLLPIVAVVYRLSGYGRRRALARFGQPHAVAGLVARRPRGRALGRLGGLGVVALLVVGLTGPRWGKGEETGIIRGRELVIVFDLSKSMLGGDMNGEFRTRAEAAREAVRDLLDTVERRGGHRLALVVFAAKPWVLSPLTTDYDHLRLRLDELDPAAPPPEVYPKDINEVVSGTRIGEALRFAAEEVHDPRFGGHQDILLLSDGDDPGNDNEWQKGAEAARKAGIPVHVVGLGDPVVGDEALAFGDQLIQTKLNEGPLRDIARLTRGDYYPAQREQPKLGEFFTAQIEPRPSRDLPDDLVPQQRPRHLWFLLPALGLMIIGWWLEGRR